MKTQMVAIIRDFLMRSLDFIAMKADQDMRHSEVAETPRQTGKDSGPCDVAVYVLKEVEVVGDNSAVSVEELYCGNVRSLDNAHQRNYDQSREHQQTLNEVSPADREESAEEGVGNDDERADGKGKRVIRAEHVVEQLGAAAECGSGVDKEEHENNCRAREAYNGILREEALLEVLRDSDGVAGGVGHLTEPCREYLPVEVCTDEKTYRDPAFSQPADEDRARADPSAASRSYPKPGLK